MTWDNSYSFPPMFKPTTTLNLFIILALVNLEEGINLGVLGFRGGGISVARFQHIPENIVCKIKKCML